MANKSVTAQNIPKALLDKKIAKDHFGQFGKISNFVLYPKRSCCTVEYENASSAQSAVQYGTIFDEDEFEVTLTKELNETKSTDDFDVMESHPFRPVPVNIPSLLDLPMFRDKREYHSPPRTALAGLRSINSKPNFPGKIDEVTVNALRQVLRKAAYTSEEKYRLLDARDKLIRLTLEKTTDLKKAKVTVGVCPDMCPEKERLMREFQRQVATFEQDGNSRDTIDHIKALKQYSRSSADQEAPLAHELRPEVVLQRTMIYLLRRIIDLCDSPSTNLSDWYNFLWDRTRSIRKDITQQELCSLNSVELVEQCARFHIHCAGRLVAEDLTVFDPKINTENLTKCLQTLKYMYHDLALKGIQCPNEAEFRGYVVLLNLNDSNFLWEIKQLRKEIKKSDEIRFAIDVYLAMDCNNYVKFFNLVRKTNYLNGCILLRYFNQVRTKAINILLKCYTHQRNTIYFSIDYLVDILGFEDQENAAQFLEYHGFPIVDDCVELNRKYYFAPDFPFTMDRCINMIESKRDVSVGQVICGKQIPNLEYIRPHNSFDVNGFLKLNAWTAEDQNYFKRHEIKVDISDDTDSRIPVIKEVTFLAPKSPSPKSLSPKLPSPKIAAQPTFSFSLPTNLITTHSRPEAATNSFFFGQNTNIFKIFNDNIEKNKAIISTAKEPSEKDFGIITEESVDDVIGEISDVEEEGEESEDDSEQVLEIESEAESDDDQNKSTSVDDEEELELAELKKIKEDLIEQKAKVLLNEILAELIDDELKLTMHTLKLNTKSGEIFNSILYDIIYLMIKEELFINYYKMARYYVKWRHYIKNKIIQKSLLEQFPIWIPNQDLRNENATQSFALAHRRQQKNLNMNTLIEQNNKLFNLSQYNRTNILSEIEQNFLRNNKFITKNSFYWKMLVSIPNAAESYDFHYFVTVVLENVFKNFNMNPKYLYLNTAQVDSKKLNICIRKVVGDNLTNEAGISGDREIGANMNSLMFFINSNIKQEFNFNLINKRLEAIVKSSNIPSKIPVSIIVCYNTNQPIRMTNDFIFKRLNLLNYKNQFDINITTIQYINNNFNVLINALKSNINVLLNKFNWHQIFAVEMLPRQEFLQQYLGDSLWFKYDSIIVNNVLLLKLSNNINYVINFYNNILIKNYENLLDDRYDTYFSLPHEFLDLIDTSKPKAQNAAPKSYEYFPTNWNKNMQWRNKLKSVLNKLKLQEFAYRCTDADSFDSSIQKYINSEIKSDSNRTFVYLNIIKYVRLISEYFYNKANTLNLLSFIEIIKIITKTKLLEIINDNNSSKSNNSDVVIYNKEKLSYILNSHLMINKDLIKFVREIEASDGPASKKRKVD